MTDPNTASLQLPQPLQLQSGKAKAISDRSKIDGTNWDIFSDGSVSFINIREISAVCNVWSNQVKYGELIILIRYASMEANTDILSIPC